MVKIQIDEKRVNNYSKLYETGGIRILDYDSGICGYIGTNQSETIQNKGIRSYLGVHSFTPIPALHGEMGLLNNKYIKQLNMLRFWHHLVKINPERLTKLMFLNEFNSDTNRTNWTNEIKHMFYKIDLHDVYQQQSICNLEAC